MKKALQITIAGSLFTIEEDAYQKLQAYLASIQTYFGPLSDSRDIIADIEARIAEQLSESIKDKNNIITLSDVEKVISVMGSVEEIDNETHEEKQKETAGKTRSSRRLFRNPDDMVIAGVASGIAAFFNIDPLIVRILFIVFAFITSGGAIFIYIALAVFVPKAETAADKMNMRGGPITLNTFKEDMSEHLETMKKSGKEIISRGGGLRNFLDKVIRLIGTIVRICAKIVVMLIGVVLTIIPMLAIIMLVFTAVNLIFNVHSPYIEFPLAQVASGPLYYTLIGLAVLIIGIPFMFINMIGLSLVTWKNRFHAVQTISLAGIWILAVIVIGTLSVRVVPRIHEEISALPEYQVVTRNIELADFTELELNGISKVHLVQADEFSIVEEGRQTDIDRSEFKVENGRLIMSDKPRGKMCFFCLGGNGVEVTINMPEIEYIETNDIVRLTADKITSDKIALILGDVSSVNIELETSDATINLRDNSRLAITGTSDTLKLETEDVSRFSGSGFAVKDAQVRTTDIGRATVNVSNTLNIIAQDVSKVFYIGNPKITKEVSDMARIATSTEDRNF